jgi:hypothetical protein
MYKFELQGSNKITSPCVAMTTANTIIPEARD